MQVQMQKKDEPVDRKTELLRLRDRDRLTKEQTKELAELEEAERLVKERGALEHRLAEEVRKFVNRGRSHVLREVGERMKTEKAREQEQYNSLCASAVSKAQEAQKVADAAIDDIRRELRTTINSIYRQRDQQVQELRERYKPIYDDLERKLHDGQALLESEGSDFISALPELQLEQLRQLQKQGAVEVAVGDGTEWLTVPGRTE